MRTDDLFTVEEAGHFPRLGLKPWSLWNLMKQGKLMRTKVGRRTYIRRSELERLVDERTRIIDMPLNARKRG